MSPSEHAATLAVVCEELQQELAVVLDAAEELAFYTLDRKVRAVRWYDVRYRRSLRKAALLSGWRGGTRHDRIARAAHTAVHRYRSDGSVT